MAGLPSRQILTSLRRRNPNLQAISTTLYNTKAKIAKENLAGRSNIQALLEDLGGDGFHYDIKHGENDHLTHLIVAHPHSIAMLKKYPYTCNGLCL